MIIINGIREIKIMIRIKVIISMVGECHGSEERNRSLEAIYDGIVLGEKTPPRDKSLAATEIHASHETEALEVGEFRHRQELSMDQMGQEAEGLICNVNEG